MFKPEEVIHKDVVLRVAEAMLVAARTAPKGKGVDDLVMALVDSEGIKDLAAEMFKLGDKNLRPAFLRDSDNLKDVQYLVLIGTKINPRGMPLCGMCGLGNCANKAKQPDIPCSFNTVDLGIALGSAVSVAMDNRIDNRIMYTVGYAAKNLNFLGPEVKVIYGIPLSVTAKNPFFDRG